MIEDPDIIKELKEAERLGLFNGKTKHVFSVSEESRESTDNSLEQVPSMTTGFFNENVIGESISQFDLLSLLFNHSLLSFAFKNHDGIYSKVNDAFCRFLGKKREKIVGKTDFDLFPRDEAKKYVRIDNEVMSTGESSIEIEQVTRNEQKQWLKISKTAVKKNDSVLGVLCSFDDVTDRKMIEESLIKSKERFEQISDHSRTFTWEVDTKGLYIYVDKTIKKMLGYSPEEVIEKKYIHDFCSIKDRETFKEAVFDVFNRKKEIRNLEKKIQTKSGEIFWVNSNAKPIQDSNGTLIGYRGSDTDITEQKQAEKKVKESEIRLKKIMNKLQAGIVIIDPKKHEIVDINPYASKMIGLSEDKIKGNTCHSFICPADKGKCPVTDFGKTVDKSEKILIDKDGVEKPILKTVIPIVLKGKYLLLENFVDISQMKETERLLKESKKQTEYILNAAADGIRIVSKDFTVEEMNKEMEKLSGLQRERAIGMTCSDMFQSIDKCGTKNCSLVKMLKTKKRFQVEDIRLTQDGRKIPCLTVVTPLKDTHGKITGVIEDFRDITKIKKAEAELIENEKKFRQFFENSPDYCYMVSSEGKIIDVNKSAIELLDLNHKEDIIGKQIIPTVYVNSGKAKKLVKKWQRQGYLKNEEIKIHSVNGIRTVMLSVSDIKDDDGNLLYSVLMQKDLTELLETEENLKEKLDELNRWKELIVGRELKMRKLKEKIKELEGKIK